MNALLNFPGFVVLVFFHASIWIMLLTGSLRSSNSIRRSYYVLLLDVLHRRSALTLYSLLGTGEAQVRATLVYARRLDCASHPLSSSLFDSDAAGSYVWCYMLRAVTPRTLQHRHLSSGCFRSRRWYTILEV